MKIQNIILRSTKEKSDRDYSPLLMINEQREYHFRTLSDLLRRVPVGVYMYV